jgi:hypothetical protein
VSYIYNNKAAYGWAEFSCHIPVVYINNLEISPAEEKEQEHKYSAVSRLDEYVVR